MSLAIVFWLFGAAGFMASAKIAKWPWTRTVAASLFWPFAAGMVVAEAVARWEEAAKELDEEIAEEGNRG